MILCNKKININMIGKDNSVLIQIRKRNVNANLSQAKPKILTRVITTTKVTTKVVITIEADKAIITKVDKTAVQVETTRAGKIVQVVITKVGKIADRVEPTKVDKIVQVVLTKADKIADRVEITKVVQIVQVEIISTVAETITTVEQEILLKKLR